MGLDKAGKFAFLTNLGQRGTFREPLPQVEGLLEESIQVPVGTSFSESSVLQRCLFD